MGFLLIQFFKGLVAASTLFIILSYYHTLSKLFRRNPLMNKSDVKL
jgi:hypothetical protein